MVGRQKVNNQQTLAKINSIKITSVIITSIWIFLLCIPIRALIIRHFNSLNQNLMGCGSVASGGAPIPNNHLHFLMCREIMEPRRKSWPLFLNEIQTIWMVKAAPTNASFREKGKMESWWSINGGSGSRELIAGLIFSTFTTLCLITWERFAETLLRYCGWCRTGGPSLPAKATWSRGSASPQDFPILSFEIPAWFAMVAKEKTVSLITRIFYISNNGLSSLPLLNIT